MAPSCFSVRFCLRHPVSGRDGAPRDVYGFRELQFVDGFAQISEQFYLQALFGSAAFVLSFILMLVVFTGSLLIFRHREKQSLRESEE